MQASAKLEQATQLADAIEAINNLHRQDFATAKPQVAPALPVPPQDELQQSIRAYALGRVSVFKRAERAKAKAWADGQAMEEHARLLAGAQAERTRNQAALDDAWSRLQSNDPMTVLTALAAAFEDNEAPAAPVGVAGSDISLVVLVPDTTALPERIPSVTEAGNLSLRKATKTQLSSLYLTLVSGYVLVTVKEAFAVASGLGSATVVVLRQRGIDAYGRPRVECILGAHLRREALVGVRWESTPSPLILNDVAENTLINTRGSSHELLALDLTEQPDVAAVVAAVDVEQLVHQA